MDLHPGSTTRTHYHCWGRQQHSIFWCKVCVHRWIVISGQTGNGMNLDDGGSYESPSNHIRIKNCVFENINATGNNDLLKLSGIDSFWVSHCVFTNGAAGGSGIDMVGCHFGTIEDCSFSQLGSNSIQAKGGSADLMITRNILTMAERGHSTWVAAQACLFQAHRCKIQRQPE